MQVVIAWEEVETGTLVLATEAPGSDREMHQRISASTHHRITALAAAAPPHRTVLLDSVPRTEPQKHTRVCTFCTAPPLTGEGCATTARDDMDGMRPSVLLRATRAEPGSQTPPAPGHPVRDTPIPRRRLREPGDRRKRSR